MQMASSCPGCRYCRHIPGVTKRVGGCPAEQVAAAAITAVRNKRKRQLGQASWRGEGAELFSAEYFQAVQQTQAALLRQAGGAENVLREMWAALPAERRQAYGAFAALDAAAAGRGSKRRRAVTGTAGVDDGRSTPRAQSVRYLSAAARWDALRPHYESEEARAIWLPSLCGFWNRRLPRAAIDPGRGEPTKRVVRHLLSLSHTPTTAEELRPCHFEASDWRHQRRREPEPEPAFWAWVCEGACHSLAELNLWVVRRLEPRCAGWRVIGSDGHTTCWDGDERIFDLNFEAMGLSAGHTFTRAGGALESGARADG